ncbi:MAG TPA: hypothetical protein VHY19_10160 [Steroidobacteraceae bacterium]|jgi:hypothetical protein|nr:hypothetical protein [Steroidobacteraceae bacterium]
MGTERDPDNALERQVHELLRALPPRRAPEHLATRVLEQLAQRAAMPWWRRQVMQWPTLARLSFALLAAALMLLSLAGSSRLPHFANATAPVLSWGHHMLAQLSVLPRLLTALVGLLPMAWLQAFLVLAVFAYLFLFGVGAAAYRLLYLER